MNFKAWIEATNHSYEFSKPHQLRFGDSYTVVTQVANRLVKYWNAILPTEINQSVTLRNPNEVRGSLIMTKSATNKYQLTHLNNPTNPESARRDIPYAI